MTDKPEPTGDAEGRTGGAKRRADGGLSRTGDGTGRADGAKGRAGASRRRRVLFRLAAVALAVGVIAGVEGVTRLSGYGGYPALMRPIGPVDGGTLYLTDPAAAASYFFANKSRAGSMHENALVMPKPAGTVRVFLCGESAMKGFPQPAGLSAAAFFQAMLGDCLPGQRVEIVNFGTTAVASFPVLDMLEKAIGFEPDLVIVYCGNNEFYGAFGVASLHTAGRSTAMMRFQRAMRSTAIMQLVESYGEPPPEGDRTLMERVMARSVIPVGDSARPDAERNLRAHVGGMIRLCAGRGVPVIVCNLAVNERDLAPFGEDDQSHLSAEAARRFGVLMAQAGQVGVEPSAAAAALAEAAAIDPQNARARYLLGRAYFDAGRYDEAREAFGRAIELDTMPWRPPESLQAALADEAKRGGAVFCDVRAAFAAASPGGCIGDELMDDHVHPSLLGQVRLARAWLEAVGRVDESTAPAFARRAAQLPDDEQYMRRLGANPYDRYAAAAAVRALCETPFYRRSNPGAFERFDGECRRLEQAMPPAVLDAARRSLESPGRGGLGRPISGVVGWLFLSGGQYAEAQALFDVAARSVPLYSTLSVEYTFLFLSARQRTKERLDAGELEAARQAILRGRVLLDGGLPGAEQTHWWVGRLHQLRGEHAEAIVHLVAAAEGLRGADRLAVDQALVRAYRMTGRPERAAELVSRRIASGTVDEAAYRGLLESPD